MLQTKSDDILYKQKAEVRKMEGARDFFMRAGVEMCKWQ